MSSDPTLATGAVDVSAAPGNGNDGVVIDLRALTKIYDRDPPSGQWRSLMPWTQPSPRRPLAALDAVDLTVRRGETVGLIGANGAGKSTLLKVVAGVVTPTTGSVTCQGTVGAMIELGIGFHPEMTGWENLRCSGILHGLSRSELASVLPEIASFAGVEDAMDAPLKKFSTGMQARLGFALATQFPVQVLAIDEVLAVGDPEFQQKCFERITAMVARGTTLLFVSHEMSLVSMMCSRVVCLDDGRVIDDGDPTSVVARYLGEMAQFEPPPDPPARITNWSIPAVIDEGDGLDVHAEIEVLRPLRRPAVGLEMTMPYLNPDIVHTVSDDALPAIKEPGTYVVRGRSDALGWCNTTIRFAMVLRDGSQLVGRATSDTRLPADPHRSSYVSLEPDWSFERTDPTSPAAAATARASATDVGIIETRGLTKVFRRGRAVAALRALIPGRWGISRRGEHLRAIDGLDLSVARGESMGIVGPNGAGKSTLLRIITGLTRPDAGSVAVRGSVTPLLDLGSGMDPEATGIENIRVRARLLGMSRRRADAALDDIVAFAGIGDAVRVPMRQYSTGMKARLGFAVAINTPADIYLIDELLAVGDSAFRRQAVRAITQKRAEGATVVFVSHELNLVEQTCERTVQLTTGRLTDDGPTHDVLGRYGGISTQWAGGVNDATSGIHLLTMDVAERTIPRQGTLEIEGELVVEQASTAAALELAFRAEQEDRSLILTREERLVRTFYLRTLEVPGGLLDRPGRYRYRVSLGPLLVSGRFDVVIAAVDDRASVVLSERWQTVVVGAANANGMPGPSVDMAWQADREVGLTP